MQLIYDKDKKINSILDNLIDMKCFLIDGRLYKFFINNNSLMLHVFSGSLSVPCSVFTVEKNVKVDFSVCIDDSNKFHIAAINRKYELVYIMFDGKSWKREVLYFHNNELGIPNGPAIMARNNFICIIFSFINMGKKKTWSLWSYIKENDVWHRKILDKASGLCYNQHSFNIDNDGNVHLVYRYIDERKRCSVLKYNFLDRRIKKWSRARIIYDNGIDKYKPYIFINKLNQVYIAWVEIDSDLYLCSGTRSSNGDYFKLNITESVDCMCILDDREHIQVISCSGNWVNFDLCCKRQDFNYIEKETIPQIQEEFCVDTRIKVFLDIKRELEQQIKDLQNSMREEANKNNEIIDNLKKQNEELKQEIAVKEKKINELSEMTQNMSVRTNNQQDDEGEFKTENENEIQNEGHICDIDPPGPDQAENTSEGSKRSAKQFIFSIFGINRKK